MWQYVIDTGHILHDEVFFGKGYSGHGEGLNNPAMIHVRRVGPIPVGLWSVTGEPFRHPKIGPFCLRLEPEPGTKTFGRSGFLWHGDFAADNADESSLGCIVSNQPIRRVVYSSGEKLVRVIATIEELEKYGNS